MTLGSFCFFPRVSLAIVTMRLAGRGEPYGGTKGLTRGPKPGNGSERRREDNPGRGGLCS